MMFLNKLFILLILATSVSLSCNAENNLDKNIDITSDLIKRLVSSKAILDTSTVRQGDFNGDGLTDIAAIFMPDSVNFNTSNIKANNLWHVTGAASSDKFHKSIVIFHGRKKGWSSNDIKTHILLDYTGALETPSFELIVNHAGDNDYKNNISYLPVKLKGDLIIIPTEAGIDTYIYFDKDDYKLFEPDEMP
ncbi:MAG: hypothetical protein OQK46_10750 [Gammaproteobacteria bacterium]|nr:hypothetical protein [Gammaproteobacteria bacterium]